LRFCILTHNTASHFVNRAARSFEKLGHKAEVVDFADVRFSVRDGAVRIGFNNDGADIASTFDACLARPLGKKDLSAFMFSINVLSVLSQNGLTVVNNPDAYLLASSKLSQYLVLSDHGLPVPSTESSLDAAELLKSAPGGACLIEKPICGSRGVGIRRVRAGLGPHRAPRAVVLYQQDLTGAGTDIRAFTVGHRVVAAMKRVSSSLAANVSRGGRPERVELDDELVHLAEDASRATGAEIAGTDIMLDRSGRSYILEVNAQPDFIGLETVADVDISSTICEYMIERVVGRGDA